MKQFLLAALLVSIAPAASAQMLVLGKGAPHSCYEAALHGDPGSRSALKNCDEALGGEPMARRDRAATHVNRGILLMRSGDMEAAATDYEMALELIPELPEAYINHGAVLHYQGDYTAALASYNKAAELGAEDNPDLLYNQALAYERLGNARAAYKGYQKALEERPGWAMAENALTRFTVRPRNS